MVPVPSVADYFRRDDLPVLNLIELEAFGLAEMLENVSALLVIGDCYLHASILQRMRTFVDGAAGLGGGEANGARSVVLALGGVDCLTAACLCGIESDLDLQGERLGIAEFYYRDAHAPEPNRPNHIGADIQFCALFDDPSIIIKYPDGNIIRSITAVYKTVLDGMPELRCSAESKELRFFTAGELRDIKLVETHIPLAEYFFPDIFPDEFGR